MRLLNDFFGPSASFAFIIRFTPASTRKINITTIAKFLINQLATGFIVFHNHPSGKLEPSNSDKDLTEKLKTGMKLLDIALLDHLIITEESYYSFADEGTL